MSDKLSQLINDVKGLSSRQNERELIILLEKLSINMGSSSGANELGEIQQLTSLIKGMTLVTGQSNLTEEDQNTLYIMAEIEDQLVRSADGPFHPPSRHLHPPKPPSRK